MCFLAGRQPQTFCCSSIRLLVLQKRLFSVDQLVGVLPGLAGGGGDGRSSTLTAACSGTGWGRDSASLTETDTTTDSLVFWTETVSCTVWRRGDVQGGTSEVVSAVTGWCDIFHPVSVENEPHKWKRTKAGHAADMRQNVWTMQLWTGSVLTERRWRVIGRRGHLPASISSTSMLLRAKEKTEDRESECVSPERRLRRALVAVQISAEAPTRQ